MDARYDLRSQTGNTNSVHLMSSGTVRLGSSCSSNVENLSSMNDDDDDDNNNNNLSLSTIFT
jgi:hypothetical protein